MRHDEALPRPSPSSARRSRSVVLARRGVLLAAAALTLAACGAGKTGGVGERAPGPEAGWEALPYDSVSLTRGPCLGNCPEYTVVLGTPGRAEFRGVAHAPRAGVWHGRVPLPAYQQVARTIQSARLDVASRVYPTQMTDQVDIDLRIWRRGEATPVTLSDRGGDAPRELGLVHAAIDSIARTIEWREGPWRP